MTLFATARNPIPYGATAGFIGGDGPRLRYACWPTTRAEPRGTVCLFPGRAEFIEKYLETVNDLQRLGFAVAVLDLRGQGGSERATDDPHKGHVDDFGEYRADILRFFRDIVRPSMPPPYTALGHSMGGAVLLSLADRNCPFDRLVLSAPMIAIHPERIGAPADFVRVLARTATLAGMARSYVPGGGPKGLDALAFEDNPLTSDHERFKRNQEVARLYPELSIGDPTYGWLAAALATTGALARPEHARSIRRPVLFFAAGRDTIVSTPATETYCDDVKVASCVSLRDSRHEILQERDDIRARFWLAFDAFVSESAVAA